MGRLKIEKKNKRKTTNGMPTWLLSTIITIIIVAVLATSVLTLLSTTGFGMRMDGGSCIEGNRGSNFHSFDFVRCNAVIPGSEFYLSGPEGCSLQSIGDLLCYKIRQSLHRVFLNPLGIGGVFACQIL